MLNEVSITKPSATNAMLWDVQTEAASPEEYREVVEVPRLLERLKWAFSKSTFWRKKLANYGFSEHDFREGFHLSDIPLTAKSDILSDQVENPSFGTLCCVPTSELCRIHQTSGTTSRPLYVALTRNDIEATHEAGARAFWCAGLRTDDVVIHCLNYCLWSGGLTDHLCLEKTGATVIPFGVGNSRLLLETIFRLKPTAISCTPTYLTTLAELIQKEMNRHPRELGVKKAFLGGEPGLQNPGARKALEELWGIEAIDANYGASEVLSIFGSECPERKGLHWHGQGVIFCELIDPKTLQPISVTTGAIGEFVFTSLLREAQPLIRFRSNDVVKIIDVSTCTCGRTSFRFHVLGRSDNMVVVKGVNFFPDSLHEFFLRYPQQLSGEYRVVLKHGPPYDHLDVQVEKRIPMSDEQRNDLKAELEIIVRKILSVKIAIEWVEHETFPRSHDKTARLVRRFTSAN